MKTDLEAPVNWPPRPEKWAQGEGRLQEGRSLCFLTGRCGAEPGRLVPLSSELCIRTKHSTDPVLPPWSAAHQQYSKIGVRITYLHFTERKLGPSCYNTCGADRQPVFLITKLPAITLVNQREDTFASGVRCNELPYSAYLKRDSFTPSVWMSLKGLL